jgi:hypothetical protein
LLRRLSGGLRIALAATRKQHARESQGNEYLHTAGILHITR